MTTNRQPIDAYDVFENRILSLLHGWREFKEKHPDFKRSYVIANCMAEIIDDFSKALTDKQEGEPK